MCSASDITSVLPTCSVSKTATTIINGYSAFQHNSNFANYQILLHNFNRQEKLNSDDDDDIVQPKHFTSRHTYQLAQDKCNEILMKRSALVPESSNLETNGQSENINNLQKCDANFAQIKLRPYHCTECGKTFIQKHHLTAHMKVHSGIRPHACSHCGKTFTHKHCLNTHLLLHSTDRPYQCNVCKKSFTLKHHLISHAKVHNREKPFVCTDCGCAFPLKRHLVTHAKFHAGERPFVCDECGESFAHKDHLVMHSRFHGSVNSFACQDCNATFTRKFELVNHSRLHGHVPLKCPVCNKEFMQKRTLIVHMRTHTGETSFNCPTCGEAFSIRNELTLHMSTHTKEGKLLPCVECGSPFNNPEALALHGKLHSGEALLVNDLRTLTASLQGTSTSFPIQHTKNTQPVNSCKSKNSDYSMAVKVKSHICKYCSRAFSAKHGLQQHNRRHPEGTCTLKSHVCDTCNKAFYQKNHLLLHQRQHMEPSLRNPSYTKAQNNSEETASMHKTDYLSADTHISSSNDIKTPIYAEAEDDLKSGENNFIQHNSHYSIETLKNMDIRMQISDNFIRHIKFNEIKSENLGYSIMEQRP